jgi:Methylene-tetrahydrofolate reductase C terminal
MIVGERKPIETIMSYLEGSENILLAGCHGCVTVCCTGGQKEVDILASIIELARRRKHQTCNITKMTQERQCDPEFLVELIEKAKENDVILSMACGAGVQLVAEKVGAKRVFPAIDTNFIGAIQEKGFWSERCQTCGDCKLGLTGGICPVTRCAKSLMNGPCGGTRRDGKCEIDENVDCVWTLVVERAERRGAVESLATVRKPKNWSNSQHGGPKRVVREDIKL